MNILIFGSGGREHALAWKIAQSDLVDTVWCAPGNPGMDEVGPCFDVDLSDIEAIEKLTLQLEPALVVIGPEAPLAAGAADLLRLRGFDVFGPGKAGAQLEASKAYSKAFMARHGIPTAAYKEVTTASAAFDALEGFNPPFVLKADGLAAGKGVVIAETLAEAQAAAETMLDGQFGEASRTLVIEEFLEGEEASLFVLTDGEGAVDLPAAQDHKRVGEGDTGPNTGGMGAYAPAPVMTEAVRAKAIDQIIVPTLEGLAKDGTAYNGVLYIGLMITEDGPRVVEYNCRFGDPECQVLMAGLTGDIVPALLTCATGGVGHMTAALREMIGVNDFQPSATVILAANGYPGSYEKGSVIKGVAAADTVSAVKVFHAGTDKDDEGALVANGGRVLAVTATGPSVEAALEQVYQGVDAIDWPGGFCRRDIGWRLRR
ncbi:MAG: phosphoribosylamine--glycine ligase [Pseudomonadota bacterium]